MSFLHAGITVQLELKWLITSPKQSIDLIPLHQLESLVCTMPDDLLFFLNMILLYALRIVDHNPVISLKSSYLSCKQERRKFEWQMKNWTSACFSYIFSLSSSLKYMSLKSTYSQHRDVKLYITGAMKDQRMKLWLLENMKWQFIYIYMIYHNLVSF